MAEARATKILTDHKDMLVKLAEALLVNETMTAAEVYALLELPPRVLSNEGFEEDNKEEEKEDASQKEVIREMVDLLTAEVEKRNSDKENSSATDSTSDNHADKQSTEEKPSSNG